MAKYNLPFDKNQVASSMGLTLGGDRTSRENGKVGGEMVKKVFEQISR